MVADSRNVDAIAYEPKGGASQVDVAVQGRDRMLTIKDGEPYATKDPVEIAVLDQADGVKRVAKADTKAEAKAKAEEKSTAHHVADEKGKG